MNNSSSQPAASIGIVMPVYNAQQYLEETLRSVQAQTVADWVCVCVDDGSQDESAALAQKFVDEDERFILVRQANAGVSAARNRGYRFLHPDTPFICFADSDDLWTPDALQVLRDELIAHPEAIGAHGLATYIDLQGQKTNLDWVSLEEQVRRRVVWRDNRIVPLPLEEPTSFFSLALDSRIAPPGTVLTRSEGYRRAGLFDTSMAIAEDWDVWLRLSRFGDFRLLNRVVALYRQHPDQTTKRSTSAARALTYMSAKTIFSPFNTPQQKKAAIAGYRFRQRRRMEEKWQNARKNWRKRPKQSAASLLQALGHVVRYARGHPGGWG